ncbi:MAG TPA: T9SS type A sorting domain-containing protein, partial [Flavobacteriales bacterium]|nr:T9SS type A sorting domain-containing protein [Flavobacteriales bacterium]
HALNIAGLHAGVSQVQLLDLQGRVVSTFTTTGTARYTADISGLAQGTYLVRAVGGSNSTLGRFVKE